MRSLHVWLLTGVLAAAACKPAVRDGSTLQSVNEQRDEKLREILIWGGGAAGVIVGAIVGVKKWDKISKFPGRVFRTIKVKVSKLETFIPIYKNRLGVAFNKAFPMDEWASKFGGLRFDSKARKAFLEHLDIKQKEAIEAFEKTGKTAADMEEVLSRDSLRVLSKEDLKKQLMDIYGEMNLKLEGATLDNAVDAMIATVKKSDVAPHRLQKKLTKMSDQGAKVADEAAEAAAS